MQSCLANLLIIEEQVTGLLEIGDIVDVVFGFAKDSNSVCPSIVCTKLASLGIDASEI